MSTAASSYYFRRRTMGRAASPPTWACYEQIPFDDDEDSDSSDSCSEDDDDYSRTVAGLESSSDSEDKDHSVNSGGMAVDGHDLNMDIDEEGVDNGADNKAVDSQKDIKGKQRAIEPETESKRPHRRRQRPPVYTLRPILTIQKSQGFVWNQVRYPSYLPVSPP
jgi:hypothetical protein